MAGHVEAVAAAAVVFHSGAVEYVVFVAFD